MALEDLPTYFADFTGTNLFAAQIILTLLIFFSLLLPTVYFTRDSGPLPTIIMIFFAESLCVALGWLSAWVMIATVSILAMGVASLGTKIITGD